MIGCDRSMQQFRGDGDPGLARLVRTVAQQNEAVPGVGEVGQRQRHQPQTANRKPRGSVRQGCSTASTAPAATTSKDMGESFDFDDPEQMQRRLPRLAAMFLRPAAA